MQPMHDNFDLKQEQLNKSSLLSSRAFIDNLLEVLRSHIVCCTIVMIIMIIMNVIMIIVVYTCTFVIVVIIEL